MDALDPNCRSIGNNRLHILVAMQSGKYQQATIERKEAILDEVMQTVNTFWKGRFLTESSEGYYEVLDRCDAKRSLRLIFDMRSGQNLFSTSSQASGINIGGESCDSSNNANIATYPNSFKGGMSVGGELDINHSNNLSTDLRSDRLTSMGVMRHVSTSALPCGNTGIISQDTKNVLSRHISTSLIPRQSLEMEPPVALSGLNDLRSAAVKSLQKQKARQQIANRLEKVSMRNLTNNNSNSSFSSLGGGGGSDGVAKRRQSSIFGSLDPSVMDEIVGGCFDDEDFKDDVANR